jgi:hypothetical protein
MVERDSLRERAMADLEHHEVEMEVPPVDAEDMAIEDITQEVEPAAGETIDVVLVANADHAPQTTTESADQDVEVLLEEPAPPAPGGEAPNSTEIEDPESVGQAASEGRRTKKRWMSRTLEFRRPKKRRTSPWPPESRSQATNPRMTQVLRTTG